jgi:hypothetical protein
MAAITPERLERLASAAFEWDRKDGHHVSNGGPWTWHMIPEHGRENYRNLVRAVFDELEVADFLEGLAEGGLTIVNARRHDHCACGGFWRGAVYGPYAVCASCGAVKDDPPYA